METLRWVIGASVVALVAVIAVTRASPGGAAFPGANGKIAFSSERDGNWEVYVMNADGTAQANLSGNPAQDDQPSWSADGTKIAFSSERDGNWEIYVMNADGGGQKRLTNNAAFDGMPSWSPDGARVAFESSRDGNSEVYLMDADGANQTRLTVNSAYDGSPAWSPDGTRIAFMSDRTGSFEIYVMQADGSSPMRLTDRPGFDFYPDWSPDGSKIAFFGNGDIYVMGADGSEQTRLTDVGLVNTLPGWSPDGRKITFGSDRDGNGEIYVMNADGSGQTNVTNNPASDGAPDWQPLGGLRGDINCGGSVDAVDALFVLRDVARLPVNLPPGCPAIGSYAPMIVSAGTGILHGTYYFDFDSGLESAGGGADDVWWQIGIESIRSIEPAGNARIVNLGVIDFSGVTYDQLRNLTYGTTPINGNDDPTNQLSTGDVFAVVTNGGNFAKVLVVTYGRDLQIQWVTYLGWMRGDVNCSGSADAVDALFILRRVAALPVNLPPGCPEIGT